MKRTPSTPPPPPLPTPPLPTEAELAILSILWATGPATVREVHDALSQKQIGYTTVLKQMQVMAEKGLLHRSERFRSHVYGAAIPREHTQQLLAGNLLQRAFDGSASNLVLGALSASKVSTQELAEIRKILDSYEQASYEQTTSELQTPGKPRSRKGTR